MNLVFFNSFEKEKEDGRTITAQVSICEQKGMWLVIWSESGWLNNDVEQDIWFEGAEWEGMLRIFREHLQTKIAEGFAPIIPQHLDVIESSSKMRMVGMLQYYAQLNKREELFQQLREWRKIRSETEGKTPFILASNRVLEMISAFVPHTDEELQQIPGFGLIKTETYGAEILAITCKRDRTTSFPLDWVINAINQVRFQIWWNERKGRKQKTAERKKEIKSIILEGIFSGYNIALLKEKLSINRRNLIQWIEQLDQEGYDVEPIVQQELQDVPDMELHTIIDAFEKMGDRYLKPIFQLTYGSNPLTSIELSRAYEKLRFIRLHYRKRLVRANLSF